MVGERALVTALPPGHGAFAGTLAKVGFDLDRGGDLWGPLYYDYNYSKEPPKWYW